MRVIISDASVLIDLAKARLIEAAFQLPYEFVVPDVMFVDELVDLGPYDRETLSALGLRQAALDGSGVAQANAHTSAHPSLSTNDCFALVLAEITPDAILLTGDQDLRRVAEQRTVEVHGLLWAADQMQGHGTIALARLHAALVVLDSDPLVRLPKRELQQRIRRLADLL